MTIKPAKIPERLSSRQKDHKNMSADTETLARKVREEVIKPEQSTLISPDRQSPSLLRREATVEPRFELFHFVFSVCSQKVRGTLMEKGVTFGSNELTILPPQNENYCPQYVRLRLRSEAAAKHRPVSSFTGQSSVDSEGFDPLVVPTLVDHETGRILADSKAICLCLCDALSGGTDLLPADIRETEEHTSELQSLMRISYAVFCLKKKIQP